MNALSLVVLAAESAPEPAHTPHTWWPEPYEIIWGGLASLVVFYGLWKFAVPALKKYMAARSGRIADELARSASARVEASAEAERIRAAKGDIVSERARILATADEDAARLLTEGRERIVTEVADLEARAAADLVASRGRVLAEVQADVARLASAATEEVVIRSLDDATRHRLLEDAIATIGGHA